MGDVCICPQVSADVFFYLEMSADVCSCGGLRPGLKRNSLMRAE